MSDQPSLKVVETPNFDLEHMAIQSKDLHTLPLYLFLSSSHCYKPDVMFAILDHKYVS